MFPFTRLFLQARHDGRDRRDRPGGRSGRDRRDVGGRRCGACLGQRRQERAVHDRPQRDDREAGREAHHLRARVRQGRPEPHDHVQRDHVLPHRQRRPRCADASARRGHLPATVRVPPATEPGVYWVYLRFNNKQVAAIRTLRVVAANSPSGGSTKLNRCAGIGFTVLHNDRAGSAYCRPAGTRSPARTWTVVRPRRTSRASWLAPAGRSPVGTRPRPRQAVRPSPSAAAGSPSASRRRADPLPSAPLALGRTATAARPSAQHRNFSL